jgi:hypothetical protein
MNHFQAIVTELERDWPYWQVWYVPRAVGGMTWCARRRDGNGQVLNTGSADDLADAIEQAERES